MIVCWCFAAAWEILSQTHEAGPHPDALPLSVLLLISVSQLQSLCVPGLVLSLAASVCFCVSPPLFVPTMKSA